MKNIIQISVLCCIALLAACSESGLNDDKRLPAGVSIRLDMAAANENDTDLGTPEDNYMGATQIVLFRSSADMSGTVERVITVGPDKTMIDAQTVWNAATSTLNMRGVDTHTPLSVCVIANATLANKYDPTAIKVGITTEKELLEAITQSATLMRPTVGSGMLMSGMAKNHNFGSTPALKIDLTRQLVKIKLSVQLDPTFLSVFPKVNFEDPEALASVQLSLYNAPSHSSVLGSTPAKVPTESTMLDFAPIAITKSGTGSTLKWEADVYTYENPVVGSSDASRAGSTRFTLRLPYKNNGAVVTDNYYKFHIANTKDAAAPHKTIRNHIYDITATVIGFGAEQAAQVQAVQRLRSVQQSVQAMQRLQAVQQPAQSMQAAPDAVHAVGHDAVGHATGSVQTVIPVRTVNPVQAVTSVRSWNSKQPL